MAGTRLIAHLCFLFGIAMIAIICLVEVEFYRYFSYVGVDFITTNLTTESLLDVDNLFNNHIGIHTTNNSDVLILDYVSNDIWYNNEFFDETVVSMNKQLNNSIFEINSKYITELHITLAFVTEKPYISMNEKRILNETKSLLHRKLLTLSSYIQISITTEYITLIDWLPSSICNIDVSSLNRTCILTIPTLKKYPFPSHKLSSSQHRSPCISKSCLATSFVLYSNKITSESDSLQSPDIQFGNNISSNHNLHQLRHPLTSSSTSSLPPNTSYTPPTSLAITNQNVFIIAMNNTVLHQFELCLQRIRGNRTTSHGAGAGGGGRGTLRDVMEQKQDTCLPFSDMSAYAVVTSNVVSSYLRDVMGVTNLVNLHKLVPQTYGTFLGVTSDYVSLLSHLHYTTPCPCPCPSQPYAAKGKECGLSLGILDSTRCTRSVNTYADSSSDVNYVHRGRCHCHCSPFARLSASEVHPMVSGLEMEVLSSIWVRNMYKEVVKNYNDLVSSLHAHPYYYSHLVLPVFTVPHTRYRLSTRHFLWSRITTMASSCSSISCSVSVLKAFLWGIVDVVFPSWFLNVQTRHKEDILLFPVYDGLGRIQSDLTSGNRSLRALYSEIAQLHQELEEITFNSAQLLHIPDGYDYTIAMVIPYWVPMVVPLCYGSVVEIKRYLEKNMLRKLK